MRWVGRKGSIAGSSESVCLLSVCDKQGIQVCLYRTAIVAVDSSLVL
jgi:hypothetical protein